MRYYQFFSYSEVPLFQKPIFILFPLPEMMFERDIDHKLLCKIARRFTTMHQPYSYATPANNNPKLIIIIFI